MDLYQRRELTKRILLSLSTGALLFSAFLAPNAPKALRSIVNIYGAEDRKRFRRAIQRLKGRGLIVMQELPSGEIEINLSPQGKNSVLRYQLTDMKITIPKRWDGKWRMVIFDIPDKKRQASNALREHLRRLGFYQLQKSVFVHPFPCEKEIEFLRQFFEIAPHVHLGFIDLVDEEPHELLKSHFDL